MLDHPQRRPDQRRRHAVGDQALDLLLEPDRRLADPDHQLVRAIDHGGAVPGASSIPGATGMPTRSPASPHAWSRPATAGNLPKASRHRPAGPAADLPIVAGVAGRVVVLQRRPAPAGVITQDEARRRTWTASAASRASRSCFGRWSLCWREARCAAAANRRTPRAGPGEPRLRFTKRRRYANMGTNAAAR